jgi:hypothetical protein
MGGRSLAEVPCPLRFLARRRGGLPGSRWGVLFCPSILVECSSLQGGTGPRIARCGRVHVELDTLPQRLELLAGETQCPREACRGLALSQAAPQQYQSGRALPSVREDRPGEPRVIAIAGPTPLGGAMALCAAAAPFGVSAVRPAETTWMELTRQPARAQAVLQ